ncbi:hypothetical protein MKEN_01026300 [Mycena kentingensis (nom. inval.)]|nr:hypothetical protein MKEN_01026300 [Mycena kentingensis (nom. inval.)]
MATLPRRAAPPKRPQYGGSISAPIPRSRAKRPLSDDSQKSDSSDFISISDSTPPLDRAHSPLDVNSCVFLLLNIDGKVEGEESQGGEKIWWPARRVPEAPQLFRIYGNLGTAKRGMTVSFASNAADRVVDLVNHKEELRFLRPEYATSPGSPSPRKRQRLDKTALEKEWEAAVGEAVKQIMVEDLPSTAFITSVANSRWKAVSSAPKSAPVPARKSRALTRTISMDDDLSSLSDPDDSDEWTPPEPDSDLKIPGELILGKDANRATQYWAARILAYVPPRNKNQKPKYRVIWMDATEAEIERGWFYTLTQKEFGTCQLGKMESFQKEEVSDTDEDPDDALFEQLLREQSPQPLTRPPEDFSELPIREQFVCAKPVLMAILRGEYAPAMPLHDMFLAGGKKRETVGKSAGENGMMDPVDIQKLRRFLVEWVLRGLTKDRIVDEDDEPVQASTAGRSLSPLGTVLTDAPSSPAPLPLRRHFAPLDLPTYVELTSSPSLTAPILAPLSTDVSLADIPPPSLAVSDAPVIPMSPVSPLTPTTPPRYTLGMRRDPSMDIELETSDVRTKLEGGDDDLVLLPTSDSTTKPPRLIGCPGYEALSTVEKHGYCLSVLFPELLIQMYAWRGGKRTTSELLPADEEEEVHEFGRVERGKRDWVYDVLRMRRQKEGQMKKRDMEKDEEQPAGRKSSTSTRATRRAGRR